VTARFPESPSQDRFDELERRVRRLEEAVLGAPVAAAAETARPAAPGGPEEALAPPVSVLEPAAAPALSRPGMGSLVLDVLAQTGWSVLALAGGFLVRALTDRGAMATAPGVAFGLAYALAILLVADRAAARDNRLTAAFLGSTGSFIANAIVAETTTRFAIFSVEAGLGVLAAATAVALAIARRRSLPAVAWTATFAACGTGVFLAVAASAPAPAGLLLLLLATAALWLGVDHWSWRLLAWPPSLCAVALSIWATAATDAATTPGASGAGSAPRLAMVLAIGLVVLWPGTVLARTLGGRRRVPGISIVQSALALAVGLGGGLFLARGNAAQAGSLAVAALVCGASAYGLAFLRERAPAARECRVYWSWLGLALVLIGSGALFPEPAPALLWCALALAAALAARGFEPGILQPHAALFAAAAAVASGLFVVAVRAFTAPDSALAPADAAAALTLAAVTGVAIVLLREPPAAGSLPALGAALFAALGLGAAAVLLLRRPAGAMFAAPLPALRTVVISVSAYVLARLWRSTGRKEMRTLAYLALVAGGIKLLVEDLPSGTPATLFLAFVFYGGALLLVPRLMAAAKRGATASA